MGWQWACPQRTSTDSHSLTNGFSLTNEKKFIVTANYASFRFPLFFYGLVCYYASGAFAGRLIESPAQTMICSDVGPRHSALRLRSLGAPVAVPPEPISRCTIRGRMSGSPLPSQAPDFNCAFTTVLSQSLTRRNFRRGGRAKADPVSRPALHTMEQEDLIKAYLFSRPLIPPLATPRAAIA